MSLPIYLDADAPEHIPADANHGLWFARFFNAYPAGFEGKYAEQARGEWLTSLAKRPAGDSGLLDRHTRSLRQLASDKGGSVRVFRCDGVFVTGMGNPHPIENGFLWHHTLGVPYLPGSAVKGLVRSLIETALEGSDEDRRSVLKRWFGSESKDPGNEDLIAGEILFFDALPLEPCALKVEVMTPHMGKWYEKGGKTPLQADTQPGDWHDPVPVKYLVANRVSLQFAIAPRNAAGAEEMKDVWNALETALDWLGAGGKTAIGFGRMKLDVHANESLMAEERAKVQALERAALSECGLAIEDLRQCLSAPNVAAWKTGDADFTRFWEHLAAAVRIAVEEGAPGERDQLVILMDAVRKDRRPQLSANKEKELKGFLRRIRSE